MNQTTVAASIIGALLAFDSSCFLLAGSPGAACVLALAGAAIPAAVLWVRFTT